MPEKKRTAGIKPARRMAALAVMLMMFLAQAARADGIADLDNRIDRAFRNHKTVGAAVVVARDGEIIYQHYYGYAVTRLKEPVTESTYFRLASVTKLVTAVRVMQLVEQGEMALDRDISEILGYKVRNPYSRKTPVTLRMLMTHTSSLDPHGGYSRESNTLRSLISTDKVKKGNWYNEVPGSAYRYSNFGAGIIGSLLECVTGTNIDRDVGDNVFSPLGITASYSAGLLPDPENIPYLYNPDGSLSDSRAKSTGKPWDEEINPDMHYRITVGSLWMRPEDLCRIGMLLCDGGETGGKRLLQAETVREMMDEQAGKGGITARTPYGLCVHHETTLLSGKTLYGHQGMSDGILCSLYYDPETRFVFVLCSNGCNNQMENRVAHLTRKVFEAAWKAFGEKETRAEAPDAAGKPR